MHKQINKYFVVTAPGLENICARELTNLGIQPIKKIRGGVEFQGGLQELYLANLWLRSASRILVRLGEVTFQRYFSGCHGCLGGALLNRESPLT